MTYLAPHPASTRDDLPDAPALPRSRSRLVTLRLPLDQIAQIERIAHANAEPPAEVIRRALAIGLNDGVAPPERGQPRYPLRSDAARPPKGASAVPRSVIRDLREEMAALSALASQAKLGPESEPDPAEMLQQALTQAHRTPPAPQHAGIAAPQHDARTTQAPVNPADSAATTRPEPLLPEALTIAAPSIAAPHARSRDMLAPPAGKLTQPDAASKMVPPMQPAARPPVAPAAVGPAASAAPVPPEAPASQYPDPALSAPPLVANRDLPAASDAMPSPQVMAAMGESHRLAADALRNALNHASGWLELQSNLRKRDLVLRMHEGKRLALHRWPEERFILWTDDIDLPYATLALRFAAPFPGVPHRSATGGSFRSARSA